jgi:glycine/D-amino acid oxidase-like deaminating enzyme
VVIGAGIVGSFAAYYLAKRGLKVALVERAWWGEQSSRNWGWCRQQNRDARELPISTKALAFGNNLAQTRARNRLYPLRPVLRQQQ